MFSGAGVYRDGVIFALVIGGEVFLKCDSETEARFRAAGSHPFVYDKGGKQITVAYWSLPNEALDDSEALKIWAELAYQAALRTPRPKSRKAKKR